MKVRKEIKFLLMMSEVKINMGCGWRDFGKDWIHIDGGDYSHLDYKSITDLVFEDGTVDLIYSSHVIAYFDRVEIVEVLKEWRRVLKPGGTLRLATPDFEVMTHLYHKGKISLSEMVGPLYGKMDMGDKSIYHKTTYDESTIKQILENSGFSQIIRYNWRETEHSDFDDHSQAYIPHMDKENGTLVSLNVECIK